MGMYGLINMLTFSSHTANILLNPITWNIVLGTFKNKMLFELLGRRKIVGGMG